jgi:SSS family solute:Na+ symporter
MRLFNSWIVVPVVVAVFYSLVLFIGLRESKKVKTVSDHVVANRSLSIVYVFFLSVSEYYSAASYLGMPGWSYQYGAPVYVLLAAPPLLWFVVFWFGPLIREAGRQWGCLTQAQFFSTRYSSPALGGLAAVIAVLTLVPYITIQMMACGYVFEVFTNGNVPYWLGSLVVYAVAAAYTFSGGQGSISRIAIVEGLFTIVIVIWLVLIVRSHFSGDIAEVFHKVADHYPRHLTLPGNEQFMNYTLWSSTVFVGALGGSMYPNFFINFYSADSARSIKLGAILAPFYLVVTVALIIIGLGGLLLQPGVSPADQIFVEMVKAYTPYWVMGIFCAAVLAAGTSTASPILLAVAATVSKDLITPVWKRDATDSQVKWLIRCSILVVTSIAYLFASLKLTTIISIALALLGISAQFFPLTILSFYWRRGTKKAAFLGLLVGTIITTVFTLGPVQNPRGIHAGLLGLAANVLMFLTVSAFTKVDFPDRVNGLLDPLGSTLRWNSKTQMLLMGFIGLLLLLVAPAIIVFNRIEPFVLGLPFFLFYILSLVALSVAFLFVAYRRGI